MDSGVWFLARHARTINEELLRGAAAAVAPPGYSEASLRGNVDRALTSALRFPLDISYPLQPLTPFHPPPTIRISYYLKPMPLKVEVRPGRFVQPELFREHREDWAFASVLSGQGFPEQTPITQQILDCVRPFYLLLQPTFALADIDLSVNANVGLHPERLAWPWMIYGPEMIEKWGEEHLRKAPVWRAEKLDYGGMLLQVAENPFAATRRQVKALADHLGLEAPR